MNLLTTHPAPVLNSRASEATDAEAPVYEFPCTQGFQCREFFWMTTFTFEQAQTLLQPFLDRPGNDTRSPLTLSQRTLDRKRGKKIAQYVIKGLSDPQQFYILPPIIVTLDLPEEAYYEFDSIELESESQFDNLGLLRVPTTTRFFIPDGQHRALAATLALLQAPGLVRQEAFGVMLVPDAGGKKQQQIFLDTNQHTVKPSKSIISLFDHRDEASDIARTVLTRVPIFAGRTALEATNIPATHPTDLFTMNALRESCKTLLATCAGDRLQYAIDFWSQVVAHHPDWQQVEGCESLATLRQSTLSFHALTLNALALVAQQQQDAGLAWVKRLKQVDWRLENAAWDGICRFNGRIVKNNVTIRALAQYLADCTR